MEPLMQNADDDETKIENPDHAPQDESLTKKRKLLIVVATIGALLLIAGIFFPKGGKKTMKPTQAISQANKGLIEAEAIRRQKDLFDDKSQPKDGENEWTRKFPSLRQGETQVPSSDSMSDSVARIPNGAASDPEDPRTVQRSRSPAGFGSRWKREAGAKERSPSSRGESQPLPAKPVGFKPPDQLAVEMSDEYQKALAYNASEQLVFTRSRLEEDGKATTPQPKNASAKPSGSVKVIVSAGQELTAVLNESLNSDYPSVVKATLTSPSELAGATLLLSYSLGQERVTAQVLKLIVPAKDGERARDLPLAAVVKSGLPGLAGDVSHHWIPQIASGIANAGLTAGALYYAAQNSNRDLGTAVLVAPMIEQSVQGVLKPVNYLGRDRPVTVSVPAGTEFTLLVTDGFEVDL